MNAGTVPLHTALSLPVNASGMVKIRSVMLMTPEDIDAASKKTCPLSAPRPLRKSVDR